MKKQIIHINIDSNRLAEIGLKAVVLENLVSDFIKLNSYKAEISSNAYHLNLPHTKEITRLIGLSCNEQKIAFRKIKYDNFLLSDWYHVCFWSV